MSNEVNEQAILLNSSDTVIVIENGIGIAGPPGAPGSQGDAGVYAGDTPPENDEQLWLDTSEESVFSVRIGDLADVDIQSVAGNDVLTYSEELGQWVNTPPSDRLQDVAISKIGSEVVVSHSERNASGLTWWPDSVIGFFFGGGPMGVLSIAANGPNTAVVIHDLGTGGIAVVYAPSEELQDADSPTLHASGGPVYVPSLHGGSSAVQPLAVYHGEDYSSTFNWSFLGLMQLNQAPQGVFDIGRIIEPACDPESITHSIDLMSGPFAVKGNYVYFYFRDTADGFTATNLSVARTTVEEMNAAAATGTLPEVFKYVNGAWSEPALSRTNAASELLVDITGYLAWCDISYVSRAGAYLLIYSLAGDNVQSIHGRWTVDMVTFSSPFVLVEAAAQERWYVTLSGPLDDPFYNKEVIPGGVFDVYATVSPEFGANRWEDLYVERTRFSIMGVLDKLNELQSEAVRYVNHGDDASVPRPLGAAMVIWRGSVQPTGMTADDMFIEEL